MCGLAGFLDPRGVPETQALPLLRSMGDAIRNRGPDSRGEWIDGEAGFGVAHRRLAIIDVTESGNQPMHSSSGRFVLAYNGEIYNHLELRQKIGSTKWRGTSDTETLLAAFETWGVAGALERANGMFAFALWDRSERRLILARDRAGEKPLYYGWQGRGGSRVLLFGSQLKAIALHPRFERELDRTALAGYLRHGYVPAPQSIYAGVRKVMPGTWVSIEADGNEKQHVFWSAAEVAAAGVERRRPWSPADALAELKNCLSAAVSRQMLSDVPLGAFLSGGIDSSTIVALMQKHSGRQVKTFTIGFEEQEFNEADYAAEVAQHLGTDHQELMVRSSDALDAIPLMPTIYDEPFADSSQIPTYLLAKMAREQVTVALSGDGGDELFGGYDHYLTAQRFWARMKGIPLPLRSGAASAIKAVPAAGWNSLGALLGNADDAAPFASKIRRGAGVLRSNSPGQTSRAITARWHKSIVIGAAGSANGAPTLQTAGSEPLDEMMLADFMTYLPDDIFVKVDRASMHVSLETRAPFLDREVVEFAWGLPVDLKQRAGQGKWLVRQLLTRYVPERLIDRPKMGFSVPVQQWLRGPLRGWAEELLDEKQLREQGFIDAGPVRSTWKSHLSGRTNDQSKLWAVLMFQAWLKEQPQPSTLP